MDPVTLCLAIWGVLVLLWVLVMSVLWMARSIAEEVISLWRRVESPRMMRRRVRAEMAAKTGTPTLGQALSERAVRWVQKDRKVWAAARDWCVEIITDGFEDARTHHVDARRFREEIRRERRATAPRRSRSTRPTGKPSASTPPPARPLVPLVINPAPRTQSCAGHCGRDVLWPDEWCDACTNEFFDEPVNDICDRCGYRHLDGYAYCPDGTPPAADPIKVPEPPPIVVDAPAPPTPPMEGNPPMPSDHYNIVTDGHNPLAAGQAAKGSRDLLLRVADLQDRWAVNLARFDLGPDLRAAVVREAVACRDEAAVCTEQMREYAEHYLAQKDIASNPDLRDVLVGYLDLATS